MDLLSFWAPSRGRLCWLPLIVAIVCDGCGAPKFTPDTVDHGRLYERDGAWILELDGSPNVQAAIFEPATRTLHGSTRSRPAASGPFWKMDLGPLLGEPAHESDR